MSTVPNTDTRPPGTVAEIRAAAVTALDAWAVRDRQEAADLLLFWSRAREMTPEDLTAVLDAMFPAIREAGGVLRPDMPTADFARIATAVILDLEVRAALIALWDRRDRLTAVEVRAIRLALGALDERYCDDEGFADRFLEERRAAEVVSGMPDTDVPVAEDAR